MLRPILTALVLAALLVVAWAVIANAGHLPSTTRVALPQRSALQIG